MCVAWVINCVVDFTIFLREAWPDASENVFGVAGRGMDLGYRKTLNYIKI